MTLKTAAFLALIGTLLTTILLVYNFVSSVLNVSRGLVPMDTVFTTLIYAFSSLTLTVFFFVFYNKGS
jgi:hypothetical protein